MLTATRPRNIQLNRERTKSERALFRNVRMSFALNQRRSAKSLLCSGHTPVCSACCGSCLDFRAYIDDIYIFASTWPTFLFSVASFSVDPIFREGRVIYYDGPSLYLRNSNQHPRALFFHKRNPSMLCWLRIRCSRSLFCAVYIFMFCVDWLCHLGYLCLLYFQILYGCLCVPFPLELCIPCTKL